MSLVGKRYPPGSPLDTRGSKWRLSGIVSCIEQHMCAGKGDPVSCAGNGNEFKCIRHNNSRDEEKNQLIEIIDTADDFL